MSNSKPDNPKGEFRPKDIAKVQLDIFTDRRVNMICECKRHPILMQQLRELGTDAEWGETLGEIAAYCNVEMDGHYSHEDLEILYPQLTQRMLCSRIGSASVIIVPPTIN